MCTQKPPKDFSQSLYDRYQHTFEEYLRDSVMPALQEKHGEPMLKELVKRWENHKVMVRWLSRFFNYLDRYYIMRQSLTPLYQVGMICFRGGDALSSVKALPCSSKVNSGKRVLSL